MPLRALNSMPSMHSCIRNPRPCPRDLAGRDDAPILKDEPIDIAVYATITNALRRQFETIGLKRVPRDVTPTLEEYVRTTYGDESPSITGGETPTFDRDGPIPEATSSSSISDEDGDEEE